MARAWSRLARAADAHEEPAARVVHAMRTRPFLIGGSDRFDSLLIEETDGRAVAKIGAEGVHSVAIPEQGIGFAIKVEDGAQRAQFPAVIRLLQMFDVLPATPPARLEEYLRRPVRNTRGEAVGEIRLSS
jgi:L-asparaginase II